MTVHEVAIVGSGPAGYTAALYAARDAADFARSVEKLRTGEELTAA